MSPFAVVGHGVFATEADARAAIAKAQKADAPPTPKPKSDKAEPAVAQDEEAKP